MNNNFSRSKTIVVISSILLVSALILIAVAIALNNSDTMQSVSKENSSESSVSAVSSCEEPINSNASLVFNESLYVGEDYSESSEAVFEEEQELLHGWVINELGYTYVYGNCGYEQFNYKQTALERYINALNNVATVIPENTRVFSITAPVSSTFADIPREIYTSDNFYNQSQSAFVSTVASRIDDRIKSVSVVSMLEEQYDNGEYVFFRTDKNWTSLAAYGAYLKFCESAELVPYSLESFQEINAGEYLGSFYASTKNSSMQDDPDSLICYNTIPSVKTSLTVYDSGMVYDEYELCENDYNSFNVFLGRIAGRYELSTTAEKGRLLIIGDSSAYPLISFLASHYSKIDLIDPRRFDVFALEFLNDHQYDDVAVICYSTNAVSGEFVPSLNKFFGVVNE